MPGNGILPDNGKFAALGWPCSKKLKFPFFVVPGKQYFPTNAPDGGR
jgi:hypothetical protein